VEKDGKKEKKTSKKTGQGRSPEVQVGREKRGFKKKKNLNYSRKEAANKPRKEFQGKGEAADRQNEEGGATKKREKKIPDFSKTRNPAGKMSVLKPPGETQKLTTGHSQPNKKQHSDENRQTPVPTRESPRKKRKEIKTKLELWAKTPGKSPESVGKKINLFPVSGEKKQLWGWWFGGGVGVLRGPGCQDRITKKNGEDRMSEMGKKWAKSR